MKSSWLMRSALVCLTALTLSSCNTAQERLLQSATDRGRVEAGVKLPEWPADCSVEEAHAALTEGAEVRSVLMRERSALDRQNSRTGRCADFYTSLKARMEK